MAGEGDYWEEHYWDDYLLGGLMGGGVGALGGAAAGTKFGVPVLGGIIGGVAGAASNIYDVRQSQKAQEAADVRDAELESEIDEIDKKISKVDTLGDFMAATGAGAAAKAQNVKVGAAQEAVRMGLSSGAAAEYVRQKERDVMTSYGVMMSQAIPASKQADIAEKSRLDQTKRDVLTGAQKRQDLYDQGDVQGDTLSKLTAAGATAMAAYELSQSQGGDVGGTPDWLMAAPQSSEGLTWSGEGQSLGEMFSAEAPWGGTGGGASGPPAPGGGAGGPPAPGGGVQFLAGTDRSVAGDKNFNYRRTPGDGGEFDYEYQDLREGKGWKSIRGGTDAIGKEMDARQPVGDTPKQRRETGKLKDLLSLDLGGKFGNEWAGRGATGRLAPPSGIGSPAVFGREMDLFQPQHGMMRPMMDFDSLSGPEKQRSGRISNLLDWLKPNFTGRRNR